MSRWAISIFAGACAALLFQPVVAQQPQFGRFTEPVRVNEAQIKLLSTEAQAIASRSAALGAQLLPLESNVVAARDFMYERTTSEFNTVAQTRVAFIKLADSEPQRQAAQILFGDLQRRYTDQSNAIKTSEPPAYKTVRAATFTVFRDNQRAYELVAMTRSATFNLEVGSAPAGATVEYRRAGDPYQPHGRPTETTIPNLTYAIWSVRATLPGKPPQVKDHDPFRAPNHVMSFDFTK